MNGTPAAGCPEQARKDACPSPPAIHYSELAEPPPDDVYAREIATYKREMPRLLAEGHEGRFVLIKGEEVVGVWDTRREAVDAGWARFGLVPIMVHQIRTYEPVLRQRMF